jgi:hypothetical protein
MRIRDGKNSDPGSRMKKSKQNISVSLRGTQVPAEIVGKKESKLYRPLPNFGRLTVLNALFFTC